ncbi:TauD/TfdA family dioxygenase [Caenimonas soli]|uniref:TauD/TfdA family dioxygenase n=1 Tax=Caenimonas soli TaxID=2735555 RepID=UPI0015549496|nr:TauD/TfdA family dioxygenase [Caenimonas soli]NPC56015.1 TauD/TfdA family dioxygenase [Caenimonas soli]
MKETIHLMPVEDPSAWRNADLRDDQSWIYHLTSENIVEIEAALKSAMRQRLEFQQIEKEDFALPSMEPLFERLRDSLLRGRGVALVKGLPVDRYSQEESSMIFWGIGTHLGIGVTQNAAAELLGHVYDRGLNYSQRTVRAYQVRAELSLHCDNSDLVGLLCLRQAKSGGRTLLTSSMSVYNEILRTHPEHLSVLFSGFVYDRKGEHGPDELAFSEKIPVFSTTDGVLSCRYARSYIEHAPKSTHVALSPTEREVLDYFDAVASREDLRFEFAMEPGDMQFLNNYTVLHGRTEYEDHPEPEQKRYMLRLWLEVPEVRDIESDIVRYGFTRFGKHGLSAREWLASQRQTVPS